MIIKIERFKKTYKKAIVTHQDILINNRITLLIGGNGSGKTTLLKALAGLLQHEGTLEVPQSVLYVQETAQYPDEMSIDTYVQGLCRLDQADLARLETLLDVMGLSARREDAFKTLSKGMKQKVNLISALLAARTVTLFDEPLNGLDAATRKVFVNQLKEHPGMIICATHIEDDFACLAAERIFL